MDAPESKPQPTTVFLVFAYIWAGFGILAFFLSLVCLGFSGTIFEKVFGIVLALLLGPFYFVYYYMSSTYCKRLPPPIF
jgi:hypothetical protein